MRSRWEAPRTLLADGITFPDLELIRAIGGDSLAPAFRTPVISDVPTLMVSGTLDGRTPEANAREVAEGFTNVRHLIILNGGHGDLFNGTDEILPTVMAFLRGELTGDRSTQMPPPDFTNSSKQKPPPGWPNLPWQ